MKTSQTAITRTNENFKTLASKYNMDLRTFMRNIKCIRPKLNDMAGRDNYRKLIPKQVLLIVEHMGEP